MRWLRILLGPLPVTLILIPLLLAGGAGVVFAIIGTLMLPALVPSATWVTVGYLLLLIAWIAAAAVGTMALWAAVLANSVAELRTSPSRKGLVIGLLLGVGAAGAWLCVMARGPAWGKSTWGVWLGLLVGPLVFSLYYLVKLLGPRAGDRNAASAPGAGSRPEVTS